MSAKKIAAEIYAQAWKKRAALMAAVPEDIRWIVQQHIENLARRDQDANRKRNAAKSAFGSKCFGRKTTEAN